jgi:hypothetical protein
VHDNLKTNKELMIMMNNPDEVFNENMIIVSAKVTKFIGGFIIFNLDNGLEGVISKASIPEISFNKDPEHVKLGQVY